MVHIILASHSKLASGMKDTLLFFNAAIEADVLEQMETETGFEKQLEELLRKYEGESCIVFTDLYGGSVNQIAVRMLKKYSFYLVTGMNLAVILEIAFAESIDEKLIRNAISGAREQLCFMNDMLLKEEEDD